jgi:hypothetical protein
LIKIRIFAAVIKKYSIVALLMLAYSIVLGHSVIPHHHHHDDHAVQQTTHHDDHHHDDDDHEDSGLAHSFENYIHSTNGGDTYQQPDAKVSCNGIPSFYVVVFFEHGLLAVESRPPMIRPFDDHIPILRHSLSPKGLRAPPLV